MREAKCWRRPGPWRQARGPRVHDDAPDLRPGELSLLVPLVAALLVLSAWPAAVSERSFPSGTSAHEASE